MSSNFFTVENLGDKDLHLRNTKDGDVTIPAKSKAQVTIGHIIVAFGNPLTEGRDREHELAKLRNRYGFFSGIHPNEAWQETVDWTEPGSDRTTKIGPFAPQVRVTDQDGEEVPTLIHDPAVFGLYGGRERYEAPVTDDRVRQLEAQIATLTKALTSQGAEAPVPSEDPADDAAARLSDSTDAAATETPGTRSQEPPKPKARKVTKDGPKTARTGV